MTTGSKTKTADRKTAAKARTPKTTQKKTTTTKLVWRDVTCRVRHTPNYLSKGWSHIEIIVASPKNAPLPITETGYRSHFLDEDLLKKAGGPVIFFLDWIEREAATKTWAKTEFKWRQGDLFASE
ncbi:MAG: hypothetical protein ACT4N2_16090 [Hyphomicrobium sp.]